MSAAAVRAVRRAVPAGSVVLVDGHVPDDVVTGLATRGDRPVAADPDATAALAERLGRPDLADGRADRATVALLRPDDRRSLPSHDLVVTDLLLGGDAGAGLPTLRALASATDLRATTLHLGADGDAVRWVAAWRADGDDQAGPAVLGALAAAAELLADELELTRDDARGHARRAADLGEQLRAAAQGVRLAERTITRLTAALTDAEERAHEEVRTLRGTVLATGGPAARVVAALRGELQRSSPAAVAPTTVARPAAPLPDTAAAHGTRLDGPDSGLRVSVVGDDAVAWCAGAVRLRPVPTPVPADAPLAEGHDHVEAVAVAARLPEGWTVEHGRALLAAAATTGVPTIGIRATADGATWFDGLVDVEIAPTADVEVAPTADATPAGPTRLAAARPVSARAVTPRGFRRTTGPALAVVPHVDLAPGAAAALRGAAGDRLVALLPGGGPATVDGLGDVPVATFASDRERVTVTGRHEALVRALRDHRAVLDHPGLHPDPAAHAHWLATLALARVPVVAVAPPPPTVTALLGPDLTRAVTATTLTDVDDEVLRERATVRSLRAAWRSATPTALWRRVAPAVGLPAPRHRTVSMVLATNRPDHLLHAVQQAASQTWPSRELVVVLHGEAFGPSAEQDVRARAAEVDPDLPVTVRPADASLPLGAVLDRGCDAAGGSLVTKVDDDDWYSPDHLVDLLAAREASGAQLVGKGAEFTYLAELDLTIRRMADGGESPSRSLAGGTFLLGREELWDVGGWPHVPRFVDQRLIDALFEAGGTLHRTHGFGFVLNRHGRGHTWDAGVDYFLRQAVSQHPGLALDVAAVTA